VPTAPDPGDLLFNDEENTIDIGGLDFAAGKKWRDARKNPKGRVPRRRASSDRRAARGPLRYGATPSSTRPEGETINPRFPNFAPRSIRIRPRRVVSWGLAHDATATSATASGFERNARDVA
jgi:hypothetical protein